ncbi:hypothetical protein LCGC14_3118810 [marine sediment metagenome]|uniref:Uncharacterized protein n=1 Tax=marine sediment metagenome TaxID=412755 RepID=A0A0F8W390_9ZZZZ
MDYIRLTKLIEERRVRSFMLNQGGRNGHKRVGKSDRDPLVKSVRESTDRVTSAVDRLWKSLDEACE